MVRVAHRPRARRDTGKLPTAKPSPQEPVVVVNGIQVVPCVKINVEKPPQGMPKMSKREIKRKILEKQREKYGRSLSLGEDHGEGGAGT